MCGGRSLGVFFVRFVLVLHINKKERAILSLFFLLPETGQESFDCFEDLFWLCSLIYPFLSPKKASEAEDFLLF